MVRKQRFGRISAITAAIAGTVAATPVEALAQDATRVNDQRTDVVQVDSLANMARLDFSYEPTNGELLDLGGPTLLVDGAKLDPSVFAFTTLDSSYHTNGGFHLSDGWVNQSLISISNGNVFTEGDNAEVYVWSNFDLETDGFSEVDVGVTYSRPLASFGPEVSEEGDRAFNLSGGLEFVTYTWPNEQIASKSDWLLNGYLNLETPALDLRLDGKQLLTSGQGLELVLQGSRTFDVVDGLTLTPSAGVAYMTNLINEGRGFYGSEGFTNAFVSLDAGIDLGNGWSLSGYGKYHNGLQNGFEDEFQYGGKLSFSF